MNHPSESPGASELLVRAIDVVELAARHIFSESDKVSFRSPDELMALSAEDQERVRQAEDLSCRSRPALSAVNFCLRSSISLLAVAQSLTEQVGGLSPEEQEHSWKSLGVHTKLAGRAAYRAALILCDPDGGSVRGGRPTTDIRLATIVGGLADAALSEPTTAPPPKDKASARILIVEDESVAAFLLQHTLIRLGYEVIGIAASDAQAQELARQVRPDAVLMDINLGLGGDGIETARRLHTQHRTPVIYLTGESDDATLSRARGSGAYGYLLKPFSERELHATIQMAIERHHSDSVLADSERLLRRALDAATGAGVSSASAKQEST